MAKKELLVPVLVTTQHRGVFFGWAREDELQLRSLHLERCRCCISWSSDIGGFLGLASVGPSAKCRIGTQADKVLLHDITSVSVCSETAVEAWTKA